MAPVRLAAGAILALSGAASWLLPDPWTPPPLTAPRRGFRQPDVRPRIGRSHLGHLPANARLRARLVPLRRRTDGHAAGSSLAAPSPSATSSSSPASSTAAPSTESPGPPRARRGAPPTPPLLTLETILGVLMTSRILGSTRVGDGCCGLFGHGAAPSAGGSAPPSEQQGT